MTGPRSTVVLLHGATGAPSVWAPVVPMLARHHEVVALSLAGHRGGGTVAGPPELLMQQLVDDVEAQLDARGLDRPHLVGNSLGGWVALELARRGRAASLVALSPAGAWELPTDLEALLRLFRLGRRLGTWRAVHRLAGIRWIRRVVLRTIMEHAERMSREAVADMFAAMADCTVLDDLISGAPLIGPMPPFAAEIDCLVRLAWAGSDRTLPFERYGRPMVAAVPQAELVILPGVGHVPMYDDPALVASTILEVTQRSTTSPTKDTP
jgi:pimeloyl-ACP methyl ester carboxylesterase